MEREVPGHPERLVASEQLAPSLAYDPQHLECTSIDADKERKETMFRVMFNTRKEVEEEEQWTQDFPAGARTPQSFSSLQWLHGYTRLIPVHA